MVDAVFASKTNIKSPEISLGGFFYARVLEVSSETQGMREVTCHTEI